MMQISLHCSSFVSSQRGYNPPGDWAECVNSLSDYFSPLNTFEQRLTGLIQNVSRLGFGRMDMWQPAILSWQWAEQHHIDITKLLLNRYDMKLSSLAGEFGETRDEFISACRLARGIGARLLSGTTELYLTDRQFVVDALERYDLRLAIENEVEFTAGEMLEKIGNGGNGRIGTAVDTGWYVTHEYDVVRAIHELRGHILHVHLKDVLPGIWHINCGYGKGCVPLEDCVTALKQSGYAGVLSVENHCLDHDPKLELMEARKLVEQWIGE